MKNENNTCDYSKFIDNYINYTFIFLFAVIFYFSDNPDALSTERYVKVITLYGFSFYIVAIMAGVFFAIFGYTMLEDDFGKENNKSCLTFLLSFGLFISCMTGLIFISSEMDIPDEDSIFNLLYFTGLTLSVFLILAMKAPLFIKAIRIDRAARKEAKELTNKRTK